MLGKRVFAVLVAVSLFGTSTAYARMGDSGYEGGISSGENPGKTLYDYQEVCFVSGEPIVMKGTLLIKKTSKQDNVVTTYTYNLKNAEKGGTLSNVIDCKDDKEGQWTNC